MMWAPANNQCTPVEFGFMGFREWDSDPQKDLHKLRNLPNTSESLRYFAKRWTPNPRFGAHCFNTEKRT